MGSRTERNPQHDLRQARRRGFLWCGLAYLLAAATALGVGACMPFAHPLLVGLLADVAATLAIFAMSFAFGNSSFYDAYWSVAPVPLAIYWLATAPADAANGARQALVLALVTACAVRLTYNWIRQWGGLAHEDWRYVDLQRRTGAAYWPVSLAGIHMFPTLQVYAGCLSIYVVMTSGAHALGFLDAVAAALTAGAIAVEAVADQQLHAFVRGSRAAGATLDRGLWRFSRHPNYLGEILFWWGLYLFALAADPGSWWAILGPLAITLMFVFVSIPMIDRRSLERRPGYAEHMRRVPALVPWPVRQQG